MCTLPICERITSCQEGYEAIANIYHSLEKLSAQNNSVTIDFSHCNNFDGNLCAALGAIFDHFLPNTKIFLASPQNTKVRKTLSRNQFLKAWKVQTDVPEKENYVRYSCFRIHDDESFKKYIDSELIAKQKFPAHTQMVGEKLVESIYEIYANAQMHANTNYIYSCGEYKDYSKTFEMAIVDLGQTIPYNVNTFLQKKGQSRKPDHEAIYWAFGKGNTTKEDTGGLGLTLLIEFVKLNKGSLHMVSNYGFVEYDDQMWQSHRLSEPFPGTIVNIKFNFNDPNSYRMESEQPNIQDLL